MSGRCSGGMVTRWRTKAMVSGGHTKSTSGDICTARVDVAEPVEGAPRRSGRVPTAMYRRTIRCKKMPIRGCQ